MKYVKRKLLISVLLGVFAFAGAVFAEPRLEGIYGADAPVSVSASEAAPFPLLFQRIYVKLDSDGKPDYDTVKFDRVELYIEQERALTGEDETLEGTFEFIEEPSFSYRYVDGRLHKVEYGRDQMLVDDNVMRFPLLFDSGSTEPPYYVDFAPYLRIGEGKRRVFFTFAKDDSELKEGLYGKRYKWSLSYPGYEDEYGTYPETTYSGEETFPEMMTLKEQLEKFVPYVTLSGTTISWKSRLLSGEDAVAPFDLRAKIAIRNPFGGRIANTAQIFFHEGEKIDLSFDLSKFPDVNANTEIAIPFDEIGMIEADFRPVTSGGQTYAYRWRFLVPGNRPMRPSPTLYFDHGTTVYLDENRKPNYATTAFSSVFVSINYPGAAIPCDEMERGEFKFDEPVSFSYKDMEGTHYIEDGAPSFDLTIDDSGTAASFTLSQQGSYIELSGLADDPQRGVSGKKFSWTLDTDSGSATFPNFLTTEEQLASYVPYAEIGDEAILVKLIDSDTGEAIDSSTVKGRERVRISVYGGSANALIYRSNWQDFPSIPAEGISLPHTVHGLELSAITRVRVDLRSKEDSSLDYKWSFRVPENSGTVQYSDDSNPRKEVIIDIKDKNGKAVRKDVPFQTWLFRKPSTTPSARAASSETESRESYGPFEAKTGGNSELLLDVDNLLNVGTGKKESIPSNSYAVKYESVDGTLSGVTDAVEVAASSNDGEKTSGGGGCEVAYGLAFILLLLPMIGWVVRKHS